MQLLEGVGQSVALAAALLIVTDKDACARLLGSRGGFVGAVVGHHHDREPILVVVEREKVLHRSGDAVLLVVRRYHDREAERLNPVRRRPQSRREERERQEISVGDRKQAPQRPRKPHPRSSSSPTGKHGEPLPGDHVVNQSTLDVNRASGDASNRAQYRMRFRVWTLG